MPDVFGLHFTICGLMDNYLSVLKYSSDNIGYVTLEGGGGGGGFLWGSDGGLNFFSKKIQAQDGF